MKHRQTGAADAVHLDALVGGIDGDQARAVGAELKRMDVQTFPVHKGILGIGGASSQRDASQHGNADRNGSGA